eukprot:GDKJ01012824.1.p1 GENE.GDKJ01012824.1~~GDKJ01012824.1.p1  ORF type:complete len:369 (+),score=60.70 GDKJ01012824.1:24-1130(+)
MLPRTREERNRCNNRESIEKSRLETRTGAYFQYERVNNVITGDTQNPNYHIPETHRFVPTEEIAAYLKMDREREEQRAKDAIECRRQQREWREVHAKERQDQAEKDMAIPREYPGVGLKNRSGVPYDIVTQVYDMTPDGQTLKYKDDYARYKNAVRSTHLAVREHLGFNPLTGEQTFQLCMPQPPEKPVVFLEASNRMLSGQSSRNNDSPAALRKARAEKEAAENAKFFPTPEYPNAGLLNVPSFANNPCPPKPYHQNQHWSLQGVPDNVSVVSSSVNTTSSKQFQPGELKDRHRRGEFFPNHHGKDVATIFHGWPTPAPSASSRLHQREYIPQPPPPLAAEQLAPPAGTQIRDRVQWKDQNSYSKYY